MPRFAIRLEYDGTPYMGWQYQEHGPSVQGAVMTAIYLQVNAQLLQDTLNMHDEVEYLSDGEIDLCAETFLSDFSVQRAWEYFQRRAGAESM